MVKNIYFKIVEETAKELELSCDKHHPHFWHSTHPQERYITFEHKVLFLIFTPDGKYRIEAGLDMPFEDFKKSFMGMESFIQKVKSKLQSPKVEK